ncbi:MAG: hypothetical protein JHD16_03545 [Solirubrobacteraceae bacterium]|nr:hypothetical protein [Solirubrobacteraceae bacterium]
MQYVVAQHGYLRVLRETNGATDQGMLNFKVLPNPWRGQQPKSTWLATSTGAQPHATCRNLAALNEAAVLAWQDADPFYNYVPWQKTAAGLDDEEKVAKWIEVVQSRTGVNLATVADPAAACTALGGAYTPADATVTEGSALASGEIAKVADPLKKQVTDLTAAKDKAEADAKAAAAAAASGASEVAALKAQLAAAKAPLAVVVTQADKSPATIAASGLEVKVTGAPGTPVVITAKLTAKLAKQHGLKSVTVATAKPTIGADGSLTLKLIATKTAAKKLAKAKGSLPLTVEVVPSAAAAVKTTLTR